MPSKNAIAGDVSDLGSTLSKDMGPQSGGGSFNSRKGGARKSAQQAAKTLDVPDGTTAPGAPQSFKKGGMVKKTGMAKVHKGERVLTKSQTKKFNKNKKRKTY